MEIIDQLAAHKTLGAAPRAELAWIAAHGVLKELQVGDIVAAKGSRVDNLVVMLSGRVAILVDRGAGPQKAMEWREGDVSCVLPYSRLQSPPGDSVVQEPTTILSVHRNDFPEMIRECHEVTSILVHIMLDRARSFTSSDLHDVKMISLG
jgi:CRP-like cAMP-binding protein